MNRRRFVATLGAGSVVASAGCLGSLIDDLTTFASTPATVTEDALAAADYEHKGTEEMVETREFASESVEVTNYISQYHRTVEFPGIGSIEAAVFATITSPQVGVAGKDFNPLDKWDDDEIVELIQEQYEQLQIDSSVDSRDVATLDQSESVTTYEGQAALASDVAPDSSDLSLLDGTVSDLTEIDVLVDVATFKHDGDHVVIVGVYPDHVPEESERVTTLIKGLEHEA
ncbi:DUF6517 family protein [Natribaculum luteum]|uniref:DUF6517 family protein n=1 Tax=Natribaculum luteum TaxID=1586232 RepID=A0ABD5NW74_9EURY|nr:DUF6517 family protein [Natribaculum luteum]